ncbi:hypothetical protein BaRGS_00007917, partial [Batillaria attramentaria]
PTLGIEVKLPGPSFSVSAEFVPRVHQMWTCREDTETRRVARIEVPRVMSLRSEAAILICRAPIAQWVLIEAEWTRGLP